LEYDAWGKRRSLPGDATPDTLVGQVDNKGYTGHEMLDQLGLVHMNGRLYDPLVARFMSADPLIQDPMHSQSYNRYTYVWNNPTNNTDPTGFECGERGRGLTINGCGGWTPLGASASFGDMIMMAKSYDASSPVKFDVQGSFKADAKNLVPNPLVPGCVGPCRSNDDVNTSKAANSGVGSAIMANPWVATAVGAVQAIRTTANNALTFLGGAIAGDGEMAKAGLDGLVKTDRDATIAVVMIVAGRPKGVAAESGAANRASFEMYKNELRPAMERPYVQDAALSKMLDKIYRPNAKIGSGSTAAAVRQETATGQPVGGAFHTQKANDSITELQKWLDKHPEATPGDRAAAENVLIDMSNALKGK